MQHNGSWENIKNALTDKKAAFRYQFNCVIMPWISKSVNIIYQKCVHVEKSTSTRKTEQMCCR